MARTRKPRPGDKRYWVSRYRAGGYGTVWEFTLVSPTAQNGYWNAIRGKDEYTIPVDPKIETVRGNVYSLTAADALRNFAAEMRQEFRKHWIEAWHAINAANEIDERILDAERRIAKLSA